MVAHLLIAALDALTDLIYVSILRLSVTRYAPPFHGFTCIPTLYSPTSQALIQTFNCPITHFLCQKLFLVYTFRIGQWSIPSKLLMINKAPEPRGEPAYYCYFLIQEKFLAGF